PTSDNALTNAHPPGIPPTPSPRGAAPCPGRGPDNGTRGPPGIPTSPEERLPGRYRGARSHIQHTRPPGHSDPAVTGATADQAPPAWIRAGHNPHPRPDNPGQGETAPPANQTYPPNTGSLCTHPGSSSSDHD